MSIEKNEIGYLSEAIKSLDSDAQFSIRGSDLSKINWKTTPIARSDIDEEVVRLKALWIAQKYARKRQVEYPSITDVTVALAEKMEGNGQMWDEITALRLDIKSKYPKPE